MNEKKEHSRSIRMTNTIKEYVESQEGNGFNEKFENMVLFCMAHLPEIEKQIVEREAYLKKISIKIGKHQSILDDLDSIKWNIEQVINKSKKVYKDTDKGENDV